jgi:hypothetical protein
MGLFGGRPKWQSLPADQIADQLKDLHERGKVNDAKKMIEDIRRGKVPGITPKEQKEMQKFYKRVTEGEKGVKAAAASLRELRKMSGTGNRNYKNIPIEQRVHPSRLRDIEKSGRLGKRAYSVSEIAAIKQNNPEMYQRMLHEEAKKQGLI